MKIKKNNPIVIFIVVAGLLFFLHSLGALGPAEDFLWFLTKPVSSRLYTWGSSFRRFYQDNRSQNELNIQVDKLTKEVAVLTIANSQCLDEIEENKKLRAALKFSQANNFRVVVANVIAKETAVEDSRDLIINRGSNDGLFPGLGLISEEGAIVGKVVEVKAATARACLTTSPNCQLAAAIQNQAKTQGITDGDLGLTIKMNYIPQLEKIAGGDLVITSGLGGNIPRGLVIGRVSRVYNASNEVWQSATIEPLVNFDNLTVVSVVIP